MGLFDSDTATATSVTTNNVPQWVTDEARTNYGAAKTLSERGYEPSPFPRVADFVNDEKAAFTLARGQTGNWKGATDPAKATFMDVMGGGGYPAAADQYMNPYMENVLGRAVGDLDERHAEQNRQLQQQMTMNNAWGDRRGVETAALRDDHEDRVGDLLARGYSDAYMSGADIYNADVGNRMQAGGRALTLAELEDAMVRGDIGALLDVGAMQRSMDQTNLNLLNEDFRAPEAWDREMLNLRTSILSGTPYSTSSTQTQPIQTGSTFAQNLGGFAQLAGGVGKLFDSQMFADLFA